MRSKTNVALIALSVGMATTALARHASASMVRVPGAGAIDSSCVHEVPARAHVDAQTLRVTGEDGHLIAETKPCAVGRGASGAVVTPGVAGGAEYYASEATDSSVPFDLLEEDFVVPGDPHPPSGDTPVLYFFPGLVANRFGTSPSPSIIIQPVLQWGRNDIFGGPYWTIGAWWVDSAGNTFVYHTSQGQVKAGDMLSGDMVQVLSNAWSVEVFDNTTNVGDYLRVDNIPSSWNDFNHAYMGAFEAYGSSTAPAQLLQSCQDLPPVGFVGGIQFGIFGMATAGPNFNSFNNVNPAALSWGPDDPHTGGPSCAYNEATGTLTWPAGNLFSAALFWTP